MKCRILVADDHELVCRGIHAVFEMHEGMCVCASVADGYTAVVKAQELHPDVVILDPGMPRLNGISAARRILRERPWQRIILFSANTTEPLIRLALSIGIKGLVFKTDPLSDLIEAVEVVLQGRTFFGGQAGNVILAGYLDAERSQLISPFVIEQHGLTAREIEIAQLLAEGKCSKEIATLLQMSLHTAETHRSNLMRKLRIHSLSELVLYSIRANIIEVPVFHAGIEKETPSGLQRRSAVGA